MVNGVLTGRAAPVSRRGKRPVSNACYEGGAVTERVPVPMEDTPTAGCVPTIVTVDRRRPIRP